MLKIISLKETVHLRSNLELTTTWPLEVRPRFKFQSQRWEASVLPMSHYGPHNFHLNASALLLLYNML